MKAARAFFLVIAVFSFRGAALCLQASTPEGALEEMVTTDKIEILASHLPVKIEEAINALSPKEKEYLSKKLLVKNLAAAKGWGLHQADDGVTWEVTNDKGELEGSFKLKNSFISGSDAFVALSVIDKESEREGDSYQQRSSPAPRKQKDSAMVLISMQLQEGQWRVVSFGPWEPKSLDAADLLGDLRHDVSGESSAAATLKILNTVLLTYQATYPEVGLPSSLEALGGSNYTQASSQHAQLLDSSFMAVPLIKFGYKFQYTLLNAGSQGGHEGRYRITATPLELGKSRSLFTDQTYVLRATTESRDATESDEPW